MSKNDITILGLLAESSMHGYQIHQEIKRREMDYWAKIKLPSIYTTLARLEERGMIKSEKEKVGNTPERTVYSLAEKGKARLAELVLQFLLADDRPEWLFGLGIAFIRGAPPDRVVETLEQRRKALEQCTLDLQEHLLKLEEIPFNWRMLIEHAHQHMQLELRWMDELIAKVRTEKDWSPECCEENVDLVSVQKTIGE